MVRDLATLDDASVANMSADDLEAQIQGIKVEPEESVDTPEETTSEEVNEISPVEATDEQLEEPETTDEVVEEPKESELDYHKRLSTELLSMLKQKNISPTSKEVKPEVKKRTKDEMLEALADDPEAFVRSMIEPYKKEIKKLESSQVRDSARLYNKDFARLEPVVDKLMNLHPDLAVSKNSKERLEAYYLIAKGMEAQEKESKVAKKALSEKDKRFKAKKTASSLPKATTKISSGGNDKPIAKMTSRELEVHVSKMLK
jgi:hypothetical protein